MQVKRQNLCLRVDNSPMRVYLAQPEPEGTYPGLLFYSDIYQLGDPILRLVDHLAGYGFVVAAPEIYHRQFPIGTVIEPTDLGRLQGNEAAKLTPVADFDADGEAVLNFLSTAETVVKGAIGAIGFCIGGHLACRAALRPQVKGTACIYPTGIHNGKLGQDEADTLARISEIQGKVLMIFGTLDPHIPAEGRISITQALQRAQVNHKILTYEANHTFMRDDGYRFDPVATDQTWQEIVTFFHSVFSF